MSGQRLLVTGGAGFIGSNFVRQQLSEAPATEFLLNLDKLTYAGNPANLADLADDPHYHFVHGDICDQALVSSLLTQHRITGIVNFAAETHVDRSIDGPEAFVQTNVVGTFTLLEAARRYWRDRPEVEKSAFRFLHISTDEVFGSLRPEDPAFTEKTPYAPNSPYAASKAAADHLARAYFQTYDLPVLTTNCSNNYGPYQFPEKLIPLMILNGLEGKPLPVYGDGGNIRDWLYVVDHARAIRAVLERGRPGETYNIGGLNDIPNLEIVRSLCALLDELRPRAGGESHAGLICFVKDRPGHDYRYAMDCRKIMEELGWKPEATFTSGLRQTLAWYLDHADWCAQIHQTKYQRDRLGL